MKDIYEALREKGIEIVTISLEKDGYYNPNLRMMFVNKELSDERQKEIILHEFCHAIDHAEFSCLYYDSSVFRLKMENEAMAYMMNHLIEESGGIFDYSTVLENYKLGLGWECKLR